MPLRRPTREKLGSGMWPQCTLPTAPALVGTLPAEQYAPHPWNSVSVDLVSGCNTVARSDDATEDSQAKAIESGLAVLVYGQLKVLSALKVEG